MKRIINKFLPLLLLTPLMTVSSNNKASLIEETPLDCFNTLEVKNRSLVIGSNEAVDVSPTYVQYGLASDGNYVLRFATAVKGEITSLAYQREHIDLIEDVPQKEVNTLYRGIVSGDEVLYYDGTNLTTVENSEYLWACYTIKFTTDTYKNIDFSVKLIVNGNEGLAKQTSLYNLIYEDHELHQTHVYSQELFDEETSVYQTKCSICQHEKNEYIASYVDTKKISKSEGKYIEEFPVKVKETGIYKVAFKYENGGESHSSLSNNLLSETYTYNYFSSAEKDEEGYNKNIYYAYLEKDKINTLSLKADSEAIITGIRLNLERKVDAASSLGKTGWTNVNSASGIKALQINYNNQDVQWISTAGKEEINLGNQTIVGGYARQTKAQDLVIEKDGYYDISYFGLGKGNSEIYIGLTNKETSTTINMLSYGLTSATTNFKKEGLWNGKGYDMLYLNNLYEYEGFEFTEAVNDKGKKYQNYIGNQKQQAIYLTKGTYYLTVSSVTSAYSSADRVFFGGSVFASFVGE